jgi:folylpolyglutamate synthase
MWAKVGPETQVNVVPSIEEALDLAREVLSGKEGMVLVTGSLHLVGGVVEVLQSSGAK